MPDASSTTVNISGGGTPSIAEGHVETKHSHGPNFGRYVEGCAACIAKYPNGPEKKTRKAKPVNDKDVEVAALKAELAKAYTQTIKPDTDVNKQLAELMLRRESKQLIKEEEADVRKAEMRAEYLRAAKEQEAQKAAREANCRHQKENGRSSIADQQIHNNGKIRPFCMRCGKVWPWRSPSHEQMPTSTIA